MRSGYSLLDLTVALALMAMGVSLLVPAAHRQAERSAVLAAREALVAEVAHARREARIAGGAALQMRRAGGRVWIEVGGQVPRDTLQLEERFGVQIELGAASAAVAFDALGIGRLASRTVAFVRGDERASVTISSYGRVRRQ